MTSIVGIACSDGVVIGTDSAATFGNSLGLRTVEQPTDKIVIVDNQIIIAGTGAIGLNQRFCNLVQTQWSDKQYKGKDIYTITQDITKTALGDFSKTFILPQHPHPLNVNFGALAAIPCKGGYYLCEFEVGSLQPELKNNHSWYCSMGSAQPITDAFLGFIRSVFWDRGQPTLADGVFCTVWTLQQAIDLNKIGRASCRERVLDRV